MTPPLNAAPMRQATLAEALAPILAVAVLLVGGYGILGMRIEVLLIAASVVAAFIGMRLGVGYQAMQEGINASIAKSMTALLIVTLVGALIASWIAAGAIPMLIYYGIKIVSPAWFAVTSCVVCSLVSLITGTSWGTVGTVGIALMGVGEGLGINPGLTAGSIVAGSYFGDKLSLFSDTTNLAAAAARSNIYDHVKHMMWTTAPAYLVGLVIYFYAGRSAAASVSNPRLDELMTGLSTHFNITGPVALLLLIPPGIALFAALRQKPVIPSMLASCAAAWLLALAVQGPPPVPCPGIGPERAQMVAAQGILAHLGDGRYLDARDAARLATWPYVHPLAAMVTGYQLNTGVKSLDSLLTRGGMQSMMNTFLLALAAFCFAGVMGAAGLLQVIIDRLVRLATTTGQLVLATVLSCVAVAFCTGSSYLSILLPGELFAPVYRERGLAAKNLSRTTEDCGTVLVPLVPWSVAGVYMSGILGVPVTQYAPWAFMCYLGVLFAVVYGYTGFKIAPRVHDDETQPGS